MSRIFTVLLLAATGCVSEFDLVPIAGDPIAATVHGDRAAPTSQVVIDLATLCPDDQVTAIDLLEQGLLEEHEIFDAFEPCDEEPQQHLRDWPGLEGA